MAALRTVLCSLIATAAVLILPVSAQAQAAGSPGSAADTSRTSWLPSTAHSYLGLNLGRSQFNVPCGTIALLCDDKDRSVDIYAGTMLGNYWGVEAGYLDMGRIARAGGQTKAQGLNLSLVGKAPLGSSFGVFGKLGTTYGRTETSAAVGSGIVPGTERGFGLSYGAGVSYDFTPHISATLQWDSNDFRFPGTGRDAVRSTSLGLQYRY
jgi:OmpA-OmpF porin, OOP family